MITFFTVFFVLVGLNIAMILVSLRATRPKKTVQTPTERPAFKIYPLDLASSAKYKNAV